MNAGVSQAGNAGDMAPILYFATGQIVYTLIERWRDWRFVLAELAGQISFVVIVFVALLGVSEAVVRGALVGGFYWLCTTIVRLCVRRHPIEAAPLGENSREHVVPVGLIDFCWIGIMGGTIAFIAFAGASPPFADPLPTAGLPASYYESLAENSRFLLGHTIDGFFALGAVLTACMAILWAGEIWRSNREGHRRTYKRATVAAAKMVFAFFLTSLGIFAWIAWPLYERLMAATEGLR